MDLRTLTESYVPKRILHRQKQIDTLLLSVERYKRYGKGECLLITGRSGSGKSVVLKHLARKNSFLRYASGARNKSWIQVIKELSGEQSRHSQDLVNNFIRNLNDEPKALIIDEVDKTKDSRNLMDMVNHIYRETQVPIIIATNNLRFLKSLPEDVRMTLFFKPINFAPYNANELNNILKDRLALATAEMPEAKIKKLAALSAREGSARLMLRVAYECICNLRFDDEFVDEQLKQFEDDELSGFIIRNTNPTERKALDIIRELKKQKQPITSGILHNSLNVSRARVSQILNNFETHLGVITTKTKNEGSRKGRTRIIHLDISTYRLLDKLANNGKLEV